MANGFWSTNGFTTIREELALMGIHCQSDYSERVVVVPRNTPRKLHTNPNGEFWCHVGCRPCLYSWAGTYTDSTGRRYEANFGYALCIREDGKGLEIVERH